MNPNTNALNRFRYRLYAPFYDLLVRRMDAGRQRAIELADPQAGEHILIVGAGTGLDFSYLPAGVEVLATDLSPSMLRQAEAQVATVPFDLSCHVMDAHALDLPDASFDVVLLHLILAVVPDPHAAIREVARVLRPGGRVAVFDKFVPAGSQPSLGRRLVGALTNVVFSDINRQLEPLLDEAGLELQRQEPSLFGGVFKVALAAKSAPESALT